MAAAYLGSGGASTSNGVDPSPELPTSIPEGSLMLYCIYSREGDEEGEMLISTGWNAVFPDGDGWTDGYHRDTSGIIGLWYRFYQSGDTKPSLTMNNFDTNGTTGDSTIGEIIAFSGISAFPIGDLGDMCTNSNQNSIGPITGFTTNFSGVVIVVGGKQDDWGSVPTIDGESDGLVYIEISEQDNAIGLDAGMVWNYALGMTAGTTIHDKSFTPTPGVAQSGKGVIFTLIESTSDSSRPRSLSGGVSISSPMFY